MAIQANALPPSLVDELNEMKRRITALERKPKLGSVNERLPYGSFQSPSLEGNQGSTVNALGVINSTGLNQPVLILLIPFHIPQGASAALDVSVTVWIRDMITNGKTKSITITKADDHTTPGFTRNITWSWAHPQPIGFDDSNEWKGFAIEYTVNKRATDPSGASVTVGMGNPMLITGVPDGTYYEEADDGNPRIDGGLTPTDGGPVEWH
ncbi:minor tail protein [Streptomyces phage Euratis]|uniref:Minor tail protein n=1 Tax=Streptomyces phage Euratis TaxID=2510569 RepID=A0A411B100_9CAUD|nr:minor tail protein [Streptomyces phage Euratis]